MEKKTLWQHNTLWISRAILLAFADMMIILVSYLLALLLRFDFVFSNVPREYLTGYLWSMPYWIISTIVVFYLCRLYHSIWRLASVAELRMILTSYVLLLVVYVAGMLFMGLHMPRSYYFMGYVLSFCGVTGIRFSYRLLRFYNSRHVPVDDKEDRIMIIGAGSAGQMLIKELINSEKIHTRVVCIIDDNPNKHGRMLEGVPIVGDRYSIPLMVKKYQINHIIYSIPATTGKNQKDILNICKDTGCRMQTVPGVYQLVNGEVSVSKLRNVEITDLLGRAQIKVNNDEIFASIEGKVVLVTGGGGSIGSELCRQIAQANPRQLIIFDIYENNAYEIQQELQKKYPDLNLDVIIGSVRDSRKIFQIFEEYRPEIVYHAAAHKHVPLMETSPCEAVKNNAIGTYKTAFAAVVHGTKRFVLISTDKAVNPTNIMGASKRLCEMIIQAFDYKIKEGKATEIPQLFTHAVKDKISSEEVMNRLNQAKTEFVAVRFGNVLGSNGSVIPLFKKQIENGGPITVTHPDIIRYFMTIPEAVSLVMQAGIYAAGGEIFVLDMGEPVKIDTLARNLIKLSGYRPDVDIKIQYTGLRPGEKLYEEKLMSEEGMKRTPNDLIHIGSPIPFDIEKFLKELKELMDVSYANKDCIKDVVAKMVNTYRPEGLGEIK